MAEADEKIREQGSQHAWLTMFRECLKHLNPEERERHHWIAEREEAVLQLRALCGEFGDNDWPNNLHLADVIEKHLGDHLHAKETP